jgi:alkylation response protein AidB-like acyl-CoA dehydrogenase
MEFSESEKAKKLRGIVREVVERDVIPLERALRQEGFVAGLPKLARARAIARETGLFAAFMPKDVGGAGLSLLEFAPLSEELGRSPIGHYVFNCQAPDAGNMELLHQYGTDEQKEKFLLPLVRGDIRSTFTMTEPENAGSNPVWLSTTAVREGGDWVVRGHKWFSTGADGATFAICMATTNPDREERYMRASMLLVPTNTPGFERVQNLSVMGDRGGDWASHSEILYRDARIPAGNILGGEGMGFVLAQNRLGPGRIHHCMRWIGICERAFDILCRHVVKRDLSPGKPLGTRQMVQAWVAESRAEIYAARLMVLHTAWKIEQEGSHAARNEISLIKFTVARTMQRVLDRTLQALGGLGMTDETPIAFWWAHERAARIYDGADEVHLEAVAKRLLREYGMREAPKEQRGATPRV